LIAHDKPLGELWRHGARISVNSDQFEGLLMNGITRRKFLQFGVISSAGLMLGVRFAGNAQASTGEIAVLSPLVHIEADGGITLFAQNPDMGQGVKTSLPMILAEELDVRWQDVKVKQADWMPGQDLQFSGGSLSVRLNYQAMREAGAAARRMLLQAAANRWQLPLDSLVTENGSVKHPAGDQVATYGELARDAAEQAYPEDVPLKPFDEFQIIGRAQKDVDLRAIVTGQPLFSQDMVLPGMLYAVFRRSPVSDGQIESFSEQEALKVPGVRAVYPLSNARHGGRVILPNSPNFVSGIAVLADTNWTAMQGAKALQIKWSNPPRLDNTSSLYKEFTAGLDSAAVLVRRDGDPESVIEASKDAYTADYQVPLLAHAPMEPMNCTARYSEGTVEIWAPTQNPGGVAKAVAAALEIDTGAVSVHVLRSGGAFGRRYYSDFAIDAALLARLSGRPVKVVWTREEDMRHGYYRPAGVHRISATLDEKGNISAWRHKLAGHSRTAYLEREDPPWDSELDPYTFPAGFIPNLMLEHVYVPSRIPLGQWRAISESANVFVVAGMIDELAHRSGIDPVDFWLQLIGQAPEVRITEKFALDVSRLRNVIRMAADAAEWKKPLPQGRGRGIAATYTQGAWIAEVAEVTVTGDRLSVDRVVAAVDCGLVINPPGAEAQVEGAILDGLSAALMGEITVREGEVEQSNFHDYPLLRMRQAPDIDVLFVAGNDAPRGLGEPPLPPLAPAVCNAIFAASGERIRKLPLKSRFTI
jgi:isoquinoline 1-oxidoreductase beta subunit